MRLWKSSARPCQPYPGNSRGDPWPWLPRGWAHPGYAPGPKDRQVLRADDDAAKPQNAANEKKGRKENLLDGRAGPRPADFGGDECESVPNGRASAVTADRKRCRWGCRSHKTSTRPAHRWQDRMDFHTYLSSTRTQAGMKNGGLQREIDTWIAAQKGWKDATPKRKRQDMWQP